MEAGTCCEWQEDIAAAATASVAREGAAGARREEGDILSGHWLMLRKITDYSGGALAAFT